MATKEQLKKIKYGFIAITILGVIMSIIGLWGWWETDKALITLDVQRLDQKLPDVVVVPSTPVLPATPLTDKDIETAINEASK